MTSCDVFGDNQHKLDGEIPSAYSDDLPCLGMKRSYLTVNDRDHRKHTDFVLEGRQ